MSDTFGWVVLCPVLFLNRFVDEPGKAGFQQMLLGVG